MINIDDYDVVYLNVSQYIYICIYIICVKYLILIK